MGSLMRAACAATLAMTLWLQAADATARAPANDSAATTHPR